MILYHATYEPFGPSDIIDAGRFGAAFRPARPGHLMPDTPSGVSNYLWEIAFEAARRAALPSKPSRLDCVFACETPEAARTFRDQYRKGGLIVKAEPCDLGFPIHRGAMDFSAPPSGVAYIDHLATVARRYWHDAPAGNAFVEVLVGGPLRVIERLAE